MMKRWLVALLSLALGFGPACAETLTVVGPVAAASVPVGGITGLGSGVATWLATPTSANLLAAITNETGTGAAVFADTPTLVTPALGAATATSVTASGLLQAGTTLGISTDVLLNRDAANTLALRNSTTGQLFNVYNTYTDASNWERVSLNWNSNVIRLYSEKLGTGTVRDLALGTLGTANLIFVTGSATRWQITSAGNLTAVGGDNAFDIGAVGATRPRTVYAGTSVITPTVTAATAVSAPTVTASTKVDLTGGQIDFPATQNASAGANTLDDYEEGTWTPAITFATPGDLSVVYSTQTGTYTKIGRQVNVSYLLTTTTFTCTTSSGNLQITGLPFTAGQYGFGTLSYSGITSATLTNIISVAAQGTTLILLQGSGSGVTIANITTTQAACGTQKVFQGTITYYQ